ncbi:MAG: beta-lactamase family protein [Cytophagales bacterium]|nr:beta-lactamase family protein [Cytophagales bacterium]
MAFPIRFVYKTVFFLLFTAVCCPHLLFGQPSLNAQIDSLLRLTAPRPFNGVVVVVRNGKTIYAKSHGFADSARTTPLRVDNQFILGSISKQTTAVLVLQQLERGNLSLQDPIRKYLPDLKAAWADSVTVHHLLSHTSGVVSEDKPLAFRPGTGFLYSGILGYQLLARVAEKAGGKTYPELAAALFNGSKLRNTTIPARYRKGSLAGSFTEAPGGELKPQKYQMKDLEPPTPAGGVIATAKDLAQWNECLHGGKLLQESTYKLMTTVYAARPHARWGDVGYGYGLQVDNGGGILEYSHSGTLAGFIGTNLYYPASGTSIVVLENVAWDFTDQIRMFYFHDQIRQLFRNRL